jgi:hypothetical protein
MRMKQTNAALRYNSVRYGIFAASSLVKRNTAFLCLSAKRWSSSGLNIFSAFFQGLVFGKQKVLNFADIFGVLLKRFRACPGGKVLSW